MRWLNLWQTELPPEIDVSVGPINGAAHAARASAPDASAIGMEAPHAAPPEPTPADSEGAVAAIATAITTTASQEAPGTERESEAWVPWEGGECPVPDDTDVVFVCDEGYECNTPAPAGELYWHRDAGIVFYRLANPTPRGPCTLPPGHPHAAAERLYMSDDTLRCWFRRDGEGWDSCHPIWKKRLHYHVGHVPPKEAA